MKQFFFPFIISLSLLFFIGCYIPKWQDEDPMNVHDFEKEWERVTNKKLKGPHENSSKNHEFIQSQ